MARVPVRQGVPDPVRLHANQSRGALRDYIGLRVSLKSLAAAGQDTSRTANPTLCRTLCTHKAHRSVGGSTSEGEHCFSHFSSFPSRFFTCFFACLSRLSFLHHLLGTHLRFAEHVSDNAGSGQSMLFVPPKSHLSTGRSALRIGRRSGGSGPSRLPHPPSTHPPRDFNASAAYHWVGLRFPSCEGRLPLRSLS